MATAANIDLPTLRGAIASLRPVCVADSREQLVLPIRRLPVIRKTMYCGDYSLAGAEWSVGIAVDYGATPATNPGNNHRNQTTNIKQNYYG